MKRRQFQILEKVIQEEKSSFKEMLKFFKISNRTLYYDIKDINYEIKKYGELKKANDDLFYIGDRKIINEFNLNANFIDDKEFRINYLIDKFFNDKFTTIDNVAEELLVSKRTVFNDIEDIRIDLNSKGISLQFDKNYSIKGDEEKVRDYYLNYLSTDQNLLSYSDKRVVEINRSSNLYLTDYSISQLSKFLEFLDIRHRKNRFLSNTNIYDDVVNLDYFEIVQSCLDFEHDIELKYFVAFIASLTNQKNEKISEDINSFVDEMILNFEKISASNIINKTSFKIDISRHLQTSFYRIKYNFPVYNPLLDEIKDNYGYLLSLVKDAVKETDSEIFKNMREAEIGFLTMYYGANLDSFSSNSNRVLIVCPNGLIVSKVLESQLYKYIPTINIVGSVSISELYDLKIKYDYIVSTVPIDDFDNVLVVKPILTSYNIFELTEKIFYSNPLVGRQNINQLIEIIEKRADIFDEDKLKEDLIKFFLNKEIDDKSQDIFLSDLLVENRYTKVKSVEDWKEGIKLASQVLVENNSIHKKYIDSMIEMVEKFGPYIVIADGIAFPHSNEFQYVNKIDASILVFDEPCHIKDKKVNVFFVVSLVDKNSHLNLFAQISEILNDSNNIETIKKGNYQELINMIQQYEKR
ncbi:BglG family transcription antiterminator [Helcococcus sueciensis]|uniref:BglG family transcription antiterminator n=1 Tax=Helcococcus sueciensis TaxID=241555 RepID=UPI0004250AB7|nr:BglG family transcription antiterminator [Helcococcus sueciensis]